MRPTYGSFSKEFESLIEGMLRPNPADRLSLQEILSHSWLRNSEEKEPETILDTFDGPTQSDSTDFSRVAEAIERADMRDRPSKKKHAAKRLTHGPGRMGFRGRKLQVSYSNL
jgi:serine/threonine protein kinase